MLTAYRHRCTLSHFLQQLSVLGSQSQAVDDITSPTFYIVTWISKTSFSSSALHNSKHHTSRHFSVLSLTILYTSPKILRYKGLLIWLHYIKLGIHSALNSFWIAEKAQLEGKKVIHLDCCSSIYIPVQFTVYMITSEVLKWSLRSCIGA